MGLTVRWHFGGVFANNPHASYVGGGEESVRMDPDYLCIFDILDYARDFDCGKRFGGEVEVVDLEVVAESVETKACEPHAKAVDHFSEDSSEDVSYQIGSQEQESIENDSSDEDLQGLSDEEEFLSALEASDIDEELRNVLMWALRMLRDKIVGCRKIIGLDGCFLKGPRKGKCLVAISKDRNNQMFPIALAIIDLETKVTWKWFIKVLKLDLDLRNGDKGLIPAIEKELPKAEHRKCGRHIYQAQQRNGGVPQVRASQHESQGFNGQNIINLPNTTKQVIVVDEVEDILIVKIMDAYLAIDEVNDSAHDQIAYNVIIDGLVGVGRSEEAFIMFREMLKCFRPNFVSLISSCLYAEVGYQFQAQAVKIDFESLT
ncbi:hypothetical protein GH714_015971 [Hevea brasiliensis]|uniref:MULE transposase domain-containing protein n=1 Tax=Hevea brasiliensis TaxID=3981 RepID=A0A6A6K8N2_HEVBR|nr:hypothetical protein GH714_015971 [Hevea brasiliensis]